MPNETALIRREDAPMVSAGLAANHAAARNVFVDYRARLAANTLRAQDADLARFSCYLAAVQVPPPSSWLVPEVWRGISWGIVAGFVRYQAGQGLATASINRALSTVKTYAKLAMQAGAIAPAEGKLIETVKGYSRKEGRRLDEARGTPRVGSKKAEAVSISRTEARALKSQPDTPQGTRDALLMCLLLDHGLRVGEVAILDWSSVDTEGAYLIFYRPKVDIVQKHRLSADTRAALARYRAAVTLYTGALLLASDRAGGLVEGSRLSTRAINARVRQLGHLAGLEGLSPHDCRHHWATILSRKGTPIKALQDAGGWSSPAMPLRYAESAEVANEGAEVD